MPMIKLKTGNVNKLCPPSLHSTHLIYWLFCVTVSCDYEYFDGKAFYNPASQTCLI